MRVRAGFWQSLSLNCRLGILEKMAAKGRKDNGYDCR